MQDLAGDRKVEFVGRVLIVFWFFGERTPDWKTVDSLLFRFPKSKKF